MDDKSIESWLRDGFSAAFPENDFSNVRALPATDARFGDFQCNDALAAAKALKLHTDMSAEEIAAEAMAIAESICIFTNGNISLEVIRP